MVDKKHQVFVSSTYLDLRIERQHVIQALLELDCIPAGMELFPAASEDQWTLIKSIIDESDYYIVISAGKYGSMNESGVSYTEMEYDYAEKTGKPIITFIHNDIGQLKSSECENEEAVREKLRKFHEKLKCRMCKFWISSDDLGGKVSRSLVQLRKRHPAEGWVRARHAASEQVLNELAELRSENRRLQQEVESIEIRGPEGVGELLQGDDIYSLVLTGRDKFALNEKAGDVKVSWDNIFRITGPLMYDEASEKTMKSHLGNNLLRYSECDIDFGDCSEFFSINADDFQQIKIQLIALGLIVKSNRKRGVKDSNTYWTLSNFGERYLTKLRALRRD